MKTLHLDDKNQELYQEEYQPDSNKYTKRSPTNQFKKIQCRLFLSVPQTNSKHTANNIIWFKTIHYEFRVLAIIALLSWTKLKLKDHIQVEFLFFNTCRKNSGLFEVFNLHFYKKMFEIRKFTPHFQYGSEEFLIWMLNLTSKTPYPIQKEYLLLILNLISLRKCRLFIEFKSDLSVSWM